MSELSPQAQVSAALEQLAKRYGKKVRVRESGLIMLSTAIGDVCVLVVPHRSEIEVTLQTATPNASDVFPLFAVQEALDLSPHAIMFGDVTLGSAVSVLMELISKLLHAADTEGEEFRQRIQDSYDKAVASAAIARKRKLADQLSAEGRFDEAAEIYEQIPDWSVAERKRFDLLRRGKLAAR